MALDDQPRNEVALLRQPAIVALLTALIYGVAAMPALARGEIDASGLGYLQAGTISMTIALAAILIALSTIDMLTFELPDVLTLPLAGAGVLLHALSDWTTGIYHFLAAAAAFAFLAGLANLYQFARGRAGLGLGDAKLLAATGAWLGFAALPSVLLLAAGSGLASVAVARLRYGALALSDAIPFGPYLAFAMWLVWLYGPLFANG